MGFGRKAPTQPVPSRGSNIAPPPPQPQPQTRISGGGDLPAELVLTEMTEEGPRAKVPASNVNNNRVVIDEKKKKEEEQEEEEDLDRYEFGNEFVFE